MNDKHKQPATLSMIVAMGRDGAIGRNKDLIWHLPGDLPRFKALTTGHTVIMGRNTWESLRRHPLPGRRNIVITSNPDYAAPGAELASSPLKALEMCAADDVPFVMGGATVYRALLPYVSNLYLTFVDADTPDADTFLPADLRRDFDTVADIEADASTPELPFRFIDLVRKH